MSLPGHDQRRRTTPDLLTDALVDLLLEPGELRRRGSL
jgi:hypothetical protein